ncbi:MAG: aspartate kinase [Bacteroidetes bacterium]|nr:aspartate kinase [Bacteroidota bacterium]
MKVYKFGGASVKDAEAVRNVATILRNMGGPDLLVVVSAMGKTTNSLERLAKAYSENSTEKYSLFSEIKSFHDGIIAELLPDTNVSAFDEIENLFIELECDLETPVESDFDQIYDQIVSYGELFSTKIVSAYLNASGIKNRWMDARNFITTDSTFREGKVNWETTQRLIEQKLSPIVRKQMVITQGFIAKSADNLTVTLGREGSDYSAAIFAFGLQASEVSIWKDVAGVMNGDPKLFPDAIKLNALSYPRAIEMAFYGATVIHPKTIQPLQSKHIPLYVKSFVNPQQEGTCVGVAKEQEDQIPAYIVKGNQVLLSIRSRDFSFIVEEKLSRLFDLFARFQIKVNLMQNSAISFSVCINNDERKIPALLSQLSEEFNVKENEPVTLFTISNYQNQDFSHLLNGRKILVEQRTRTTLQWVLQE